MEKKFDELYKIRHSLAHVMAQAVLQLRPRAKLAFGPPIDTGCYYDFMFDQPISSEDFPEIEKRMRAIIKEKQKFEQGSRTATAAVEYLRTLGESFKVEYCEELIGRGESEIGFYKNGPFEDMCAGPHVNHTGEIPGDCFKLDSVAGAYWRGSEKNPQLSRIYCLAFHTNAELKDYLERRRVAAERDHRKLGKELELFAFADQVGPGLPLWLPHGTVLREELEKLAKETEQRAGYQRVATPHLAKEDLYLTSGHLPYYKDSMFPPMSLEGESNYYLKAMNCPHHHLIYGHRPRSYRELPLRLAEYGTCYRYEASGTLSGLLRVRALSMNDAHIYCTLDQLEAEILASINLTLGYYQMFRFQGVKARFSTHDPANKEKFIDDPEMWKFTEAAVERALRTLNVDYDLGPGEAAFYGPKIDYQAKTLLGREETISTSQLDAVAAQKFTLRYTGEDGREHPPYVIHRAPLSTHERFVAFLIEHLGAAFPTWLAPVQVLLVPVSEAFNDYVSKLADRMRDLLFRVEADFSDSSFNKKIREGTVRKIPNILVIGQKEIEADAVNLRRYCKKEQETLKTQAFMDRLLKLRAERIMDNFSDVEVLK